MYSRILGNFEIISRFGVRLIITLHICGTPDEVFQEILTQQKELGFGVFVANLNYGDMPHQKAMKNIMIFATEVMPRLKEVVA